MANPVAKPVEGKIGKSAHEVINSPEFKSLVARRWTVSIVLTIALFVIYYGYILLIAANKQAMSQKIGEVTTLAIPVGVGVIIAAWVLTAIYVLWANAAYDPKVEHFKGQLK